MDHERNEDGNGDRCLNIPKAELSATLP
jgi:hypothetical protein